MNDIYTMDERAHSQNCPICGFWHTSSGCPPQVSAQSARIIELMSENNALRKQVEDALRGSKDSADWFDCLKIDYDILRKQVEIAVETLENIYTHEDNFTKAALVKMAVDALAKITEATDDQNR